MGPLGLQGPKGEDQQHLNDQEDLKAHQDIKVNCMGEMQVPTGPVRTTQPVIARGEKGYQEGILG